MARGCWDLHGDQRSLSLSSALSVKSGGPHLLHEACFSRKPMDGAAFGDLACFSVGVRACLCLESCME